MFPLPHPLRFLVVALAGWINQQEREVIDYLQAENRVLCEQLGPRSIKESCLNQVIPVGDASLRRAVHEFVAHYHHERNHQGLGNVLIFPTRVQRRSDGRMRPNTPFLDWLHATDPTSVTLTLADLGREPMIYLVPECGDAEDERAALQTVFPTTFEDQLNGWWRDRTTWLTPRSFGAFAFFDWRFHSTLFDLTDEPLIEEHV